MGKELHLVLVGLSLSFDGVLVGENSSKNSVSLCEFFFCFLFLCGLPDTWHSCHQLTGGSSNGTGREREPGETEETNFHTPTLKLDY